MTILWKANPRNRLLQYFFMNPDDTRKMDELLAVLSPKLKDFYLEQPIAEEFLLAPDLLERTVEQFRRTQPFIAILNRAIRYAHEEMQ